MRRPLAVLTMDHVEGYSPSVRRSVSGRRRAPEPGVRAVQVAATIAWAAASRATGTRNGEHDT
jgi:uncharacterized protein (DUF2126 family)